MNKEEFLKRAINRICKDYDYNFANELELIYINLQQENKQLKGTIDKAIEYIESFGISNNDLKGLGECPITINDLCKLLEILKGGNNE